MLGIWEYFWNLLDWTAPVVSPINLCQVTATVTSVKTSTATTAQLTNMTTKV